MEYRPAKMRKVVQLMVIITILAWATQVLFHQWGFGAEIAAQEKFVARNGMAGTLELRAEATVIGRDVKLKQVCRWSEQQARVFEPIADLVVLHLETERPYRSISMDELKDLVAGAGVNVAPICFTGATTCTVARSDVQVDERKALQAWIDAKLGRGGVTPPSLDEPKAQAAQ